MRDDEWKENKLLVILNTFLSLVLIMAEKMITFGKLIARENSNPQTQGLQK
jgi:hypothetical protein